MVPTQVAGSAGSCTGMQKKRPAWAQAVSVFRQCRGQASIRRSTHPGATVVDTDVRALADPVQIALADDGGATVIHAHVHVVGPAADVLLDGTAGNGTSHGAGDGCGVLAALAVGLAIGYLAACDGADQATQYCSRGARGGAAPDHFNAGHGATVVATHAAAARGRGAAISRRAVPGGGAGREGQGGDCSTTDREKVRGV